METYDLAVVGAGPGGYVAAIRASSLGLKTVLIEKEKHPGGTCLNKGCIPTKVLCHISERYREAGSYKDIGILSDNLSLDIDGIHKRKKSVIDQLRKNLNHLLSRKKIDLIYGEADVLKNKTINIMGESSDTISARHVLLAVGSRPVVPPSWEVDSEILMTSDEILNCQKIPKTLLVIGGGVIGMEFASIFSSFGSQVTVVEALPSILPFEDQEISSGLKRVFEKKKVVFHTGTKVGDIKKISQSLHITFIKPDGKSFTESYEAALISIGRSPVLNGLEKLDLEKKANGSFIKVNKFYETSLPGFFAVGDVIGATGLAHGASAEGIICAEKIAGLNPKPLNYHHIPSCIYTDPEIARVGLTEEKAREIHGDEIEISTYPLRAIGKAQIINHIEGMVKIIVEKKYKEVLGISLMGAHVTEMIAGHTIALNIEATLEDLSNAVFPHPSLSEMVMECAKKLAGNGIHS